MRRQNCRAFGVAVLLAVAARAVLADDAPALGRASYTLAVVPQRQALVTYRAWSPLAARLSRETGADIHLKMYEDFRDFEAAVGNGTPDFVFLNPFQQVIAHRAQGYRPLVRDGSKQLTGILVVRRDSPYRTPRDLAGKALAFPSPNAFGASLLTRAALAERWNIAFTTTYVGTHGNVFRHVLLGKVAAGGAVNRTLNEETPEVRAGLRIIHETDGFAPHPLSAHPRVPKSMQRAVRDALLGLAGDAAGRGLLNAVTMPQPVPADYARDYRPLDNLGLDRYHFKGSN